MTPVLHRRFPFSTDTASRVARQALGSLASAWRGFVRDFSQRRKARAALRSLCELDVAVLRDLGIARGELQAVAVHPSRTDNLWIHP